MSALAAGVTWWSKLHDPRGDRHDIKSWPELREWLGRPAERPRNVEKPDLAGWSPAIFRGDERAKANVEHVTALGLDVDKGDVPLERLREVLAGWSAIVHSTRRYTPSSPRWRVVVAVTRAMLPEEHAAVWSFARAHFADAGITLDESTKDPSRFWYMPCEPQEGDFVVEELAGNELDVDQLVRWEAERAPQLAMVPPASASRTPRYGAAALEDACRRVASASNGSRNSTLNDQAFAIARLVAGGLIDDGGAARADLEASAQRAGLSAAEARKTIGSAFDAGLQKPRSKPELSAVPSPSTHEPTASVTVDAAAFEAARRAPFREVAALVGELRGGVVRCGNCGGSETSIESSTLTCRACTKRMSTIELVRRAKKLRDDVAAVAFIVGALGITTAAAHAPPPLLGSLLAATLERIRRRAEKIERPIELPWSVLAPHFGGGLWPGLHVLTSGTGVGKTQLALQLAASSARRGIPVLYVGLELGELDLAMRMLGEAASVPWSKLFTGDAGPKYVARVEEAAPSLKDLPFHLEVSRPHGFAPTALVASVTALRAQYPETDGPGSRPLLVVVDFLQLIGDEPEESKDTRDRVGRASYALRHLVNALGVTVVCISSVARERYKVLEDILGQAQLRYEVDDQGTPRERAMLNADAIVGLGKESGDIEFSADSVSVLARVGATWDGRGCDVVFATAKGRATGATWSPLHFTGFRYEECRDEGRRLVDAWKADAEKRERAREEKKAAKDEAKVDKARADADAVRAYVLANPNAGYTKTRLETVSGNAARWKKVEALLGDELVQVKAGKSTLLRVVAATTSAPGGESWEV